MTHFFRLETAQLLLEKLTRDLARVERWPNDVDMAFDFFLTADAILDWLYSGPSAQHQREDLHNDPLLRAVRELASGANPLELKRGERAQRVLAVELSGRAAQKYGSRLSVLDMARHVHAYWTTQLPLRCGRG